LFWKNPDMDIDEENSKVTISTAQWSPTVLNVLDRSRPQRPTGRFPATGVSGVVDPKSRGAVCSKGRDMVDVLKA
jgi:hypothetical protein